MFLQAQETRGKTVFYIRIFSSNSDTSCCHGSGSVVIVTSKLPHWILSWISSYHLNLFLQEEEEEEEEEEVYTW